MALTLDEDIGLGTQGGVEPRAHLGRGVRAHGTPSRLGEHPTDPLLQLPERESGALHLGQRVHDQLGGRLHRRSLGAGAGEAWQRQRRRRRAARKLREQDAKLLATDAHAAARSETCDRTGAVVGAVDTRARRAADLKLVCTRERLEDELYVGCRDGRVGSDHEVVAARPRLHVRWSVADRAWQRGGVEAQTGTVATGQPDQLGGGLDGLRGLTAAIRRRDIRLRGRRGRGQPRRLLLLGDTGHPGLIGARVLAARALDLGNARRLPGRPVARHRQCEGLRVHVTTAAVHQP